jgi:hypothetical protein
MTINYEDIINVLDEVFRIRLVITPDDEYTADFSNGNPLGKLSRGDLSRLAEAVNAFDVCDDGSVVTKNSFEVLVQPRQESLRMFRGDINLEDPHSGISYRFGQPSDAFAVYLCFRLRDLLNEAGRREWAFRLNLMRSRIRGRDVQTSVLDFVKESLRVRSLLITSSTSRPKTAWKNDSDSFFFHVGYNLDIAIMPDRNLSELIGPVKISSMRRSRSVELDAPRRHYISDLVYHYQLGVSAESPMLEYISYYHVAEHWFENIYQDDLVEQIQQAITSPAFSYKRKKDLRDLIRKVSRAVQLRDDQLVINEQVALRLTLAKYLDLSQLATDLTSYDSTLLNYYAHTPVGFCGGDVVDLTQADPTVAITALANRIYKTRNALVHSKEGSKGKFVPFANDRELVPEVPLVRFVAEQIIIATSTIPS